VEAGRDSPSQGPVVPADSAGEQIGEHEPTVAVATGHDIHQVVDHVDKRSRGAGAYPLPRWSPPTQGGDERVLQAQDERPRFVIPREQDRQRASTEATTWAMANRGEGEVQRVAPEAADAGV
jgi:hypothetical protein